MGSMQFCNYTVCSIITVQYAICSMQYYNYILKVLNYPPIPYDIMFDPACNGKSPLLLTTNYY